MKLNDRMMNETYVSKGNELINVLINKEIGLHRVYVAMGSGKTFSVKQLLSAEAKDSVYGVVSKNEYPILCVSPYRVARDDYESVGAEYLTSLPTDRQINHSFAYISSLLESLVWYSREMDVDITTAKGEDDACKIAALAMYVNNPNLTIIVDEYDAVQLQANMTKTNFEIFREGRIQHYLKVSNWEGLMELMLQHLARYFPVILLSATTKGMDVEGSEEIVQLGTSVRIPVYFNHLYTKQPLSVILNKVEEVVQQSVETNVPVIVYASHFPQEYYELMGSLAAKGVPSLLLSSNTRLAHMNYDGVRTMCYNHYNMPVHKGGVIDVDKAYVAVVDTETTLSSMFKQGFKVVFINMNQSRVVSIHSEGEFASGTVITVSKKLSNAVVQAGGRFRDVPVIQHCFFTDGGDLVDNEGEAAYNKLKQFSPCHDEYGTQFINAEYVPYVVPCRVEGRKGERVGKAVSSKTQAKKEAINTFLQNTPKGSYPLYCSVVPEDLQYNKNKFSEFKKAIKGEK